MPPNQREGLAWRQFVTGLGLGACLADDMGLGKTIQVLENRATDRAFRIGQRRNVLVHSSLPAARWRSGSTP